MPYIFLRWLFEVVYGFFFFFFGILIPPSILHGYSVYRATASILSMIENIAFGNHSTLRIIGKSISDWF